MTACTTRRIGAMLLVAALAAWAATPAFAAVKAQYVADSYEPDGQSDYPANFASNGVTQAHTIHTATDLDFVSYSVNAGDVIKVEAVPLGAASPGVRLYAVDPSGGSVQLTLNETAQLGESGAGLRWRAEVAGTYRAVFYGVPTGATSEYNATLSSWPGSDPTTITFAGADRYAVAANTARVMRAGRVGTSDHVILASGLDRAAADSLVAAGLSGVYGYAPIVLAGASSTSLPPATKSVLAAHYATAKTAGRSLTVHIVGGLASVPETLKADILKAAPGAKFDRIAGSDRYGVAANVAARMRTLLGSTYPRKCLVVNGQNAAYFSDALAAGPIAARAHLPILLVSATAVPPATAAALKVYTQEHWAVATGAAINASTLAAINTHGQQPILGADRYRLARALAETAEEHAWLHTNAAAVVNKLPDALAAGPYAGKADAPLLYVRESLPLPNSTRDFLQLRACGPYRTGSMSGVAFFGGGASMPTAVRARCARLAGELP